ncbi:hypothetical protein IHV09_22145 [Fictibacillus sp. 23RED33]|uniref:hypothetical protein n=1 Tax=Fictibacillus sp. 23RED33 TaxID=2745879 RepID=UPI0018CF51BB|nr:hypothetical protein [Fictibacillus sp. 23RED33]MBH0176262.1 hypothetical protein [Fictibacillus sp. 23RED33]
MKKVEALYQEVSPKYQMLAEKKNEITETVSRLGKELAAAEENYDIQSVGKLTQELDVAIKMRDSLNAKYRNEIEANSKELLRKLEPAIQEDWNQVVAAEESLRDKAKKHIEEAISLLNEYQSNGHKRSSELTAVVHQFAGILTDQDRSLVNGLANHKNLKPTFSNDLQQISNRLN